MEERVKKDQRRSESLMKCRAMAEKATRYGPLKKMECLLTNVEFSSVFYDLFDHDAGTGKLNQHDWIQILHDNIK